MKSFPLLDTENEPKLVLTTLLIKRLAIEQSLDAHFSAFKTLFLAMVYNG